MYISKCAMWVLNEYFTLVSEYTFLHFKFAQYVFTTQKYS